MDIESTERRELMLGAAHAAIWGATLTATGFPAAAATPILLGADISARLPKGGSSQFADINGIRTHYVTAGTGPVVVLLHGWPQTWFAWHGTIERLSQSFTVIAPDLRGIGLSEKTPSGYDKRTIAADIQSLIAHAAGGRANVVGHDMGGKAAYMLAHLHPECIERLVMVDCLLPGTEYTDALRGGAWHYGFHMAPQIPEMLTKGREREYIAAQIRSWSHRKDAVTEEAISEFARHYASPGGMTAGFNYYRTLREDAELAASFTNRRLGMPVLAIGGRHSAGTKLADALYQQSSKLTAVIAEDSGHFVAEEVPNFFGDQVELFLRA
jgi:pimeloyl-ACP methyl ester carboxylesterase